MSDATPHSVRPPGSLGGWWALLVDVVAVILFAALGRGAHQRTSGVAGLVETAWPFLVGLCVGWILWVATRRESPVVVAAGATFWASTLVVGMTIWGFREGKVPHWSFLVVAGVATALLLVGWRLVARTIGRRRR